MKKNILFIMNNLNCGGAEKALISLLESIDYNEYDVDLFLFKHEGIFLERIPSRVCLLEEPKEYRFFDMSFKQAIIDSLKKGKFDVAILRVLAGYVFKKEKNGVLCEQKVWKYISKSLSRINKKYEAAVGYLEKSPIYFCIDKVDAKRKIGFIHNDYNKLGMDSTIDNKYFKKLDKIITVSQECATVLRKEFEIYSNKIEVMHNIISPNIIKKMSYLHSGIMQGGIKIVSVGRLTQQKGFELAIDACKTLVEEGYDIKWYVIGDGNERRKIENLIEKHNLQERFILLGIKDNPYPYIRESDIYVQPSRFEGKSIAIDEAKILNKPIIVTNFSTAKDQINHEENGLIVGMNGPSIVAGIKRLCNDESLRSRLIHNLSQADLGTESEILKLYEFIEAG
ncbi:glycosyltransferase [Rossellomorea vietnamensis]|uniref:Glycosyl transferase family 1 n=1 Tax=Rossellomorea vietnamensis TaxID=218284 RepID=A0A0N8GG83_9BACI|nr:glycosyltransferase [Rossellomorea vietnamensis]KPL57778.1 glycosyl transferase family 1 [Rossellomorea vietnamensis]